MKSFPVCWSWSLAASLGLTSPAQVAGELERAGDGCRLVVHAAGLSEEFASGLADEANGQVEKFLTFLGKTLGSRRRQVSVVHLYCDAAEYGRVERQSSPYPFELGGFVTTAGVGHVSLGPEQDPRHFAHTGLPQPVADWLLLVVAEQVVAPVVPPSEIADWVKWILVVGSVESFTNPGHAPGVNSTHDFRRVRLHYLRRHGSELTFAGSAAHADPVKNQNYWHWRACHAAISAQTMAAVEPQWAQKLLRKHRLPRGQSGEMAMRRVATSAVVGKDWRKAEQIFQEALGSNDPDWVELSPLWLPSPQRSMLIGPKNAQASILCSTGKMPTGDYAVFGRATLGDGSTNGLVVSFGWDQKSEVAVGFTDGVAWISEWFEAGNRTEYRAQTEVPIAPGRPFDFRIEVTGSVVAIAIDGAAALSWQHGGREVHMAIKVSVYDRVVWLEGLGYEALPR